MTNAPSNRRLYGLLAATLAVLGLASITTANARPAATDAVISVPRYSDTIPNIGDRNSPRVREIQQWLRDRGFRPGPTDGWYGNQTKAAIERFQTAATEKGFYSGPVDGIWSVDIDNATIPWGDQKPSAPVAAQTSYSGLPCAQWHGLLEQYGLPVREFSRIMRRESNCDPGAVNRSSGARGLLQVMPQWATRWGGCEAQGICSPDQLLDPETNIRASARIFALQGFRAWSQTCC